MKLYFLQIRTVCGLILLFLPELLACKTVYTEHKPAVVPSLLNILQTPTGGEKENTQHLLSSAGQPARKIVKIDNPNQLTYKNLNRDMIQNLRRRLNRGPASSELGADVRQTSPGISTPCRFLSGYRSSGRCTEFGSCRVGNIEHQNNVRQTEDLSRVLAIIDDHY